MRGGTRMEGRKNMRVVFMGVFEVYRERAKYWKCWKGGGRRRARRKNNRSNH